MQGQQNIKKKYDFCNVGAAFSIDWGLNFWRTEAQVCLVTLQFCFFNFLVLYFQIFIETVCLYKWRIMENMAWKTWILWRRYNYPIDGSRISCYFHGRWGNLSVMWLAFVYALMREKRINGVGRYKDHCQSCCFHIIRHTVQLTDCQLFALWRVGLWIRGVPILCLWFQLVKNAES